MKSLIQIIALSLLCLSTQAQIVDYFYPSLENKKCFNRIFHYATDYKTNEHGNVIYFDSFVSYSILPSGHIETISKSTLNKDGKSLPMGVTISSYIAENNLIKQVEVFSSFFNKTSKTNNIVLKYPPANWVEIDKDEVLEYHYSSSFDKLVTKYGEYDCIKVVKKNKAIDLEFKEYENETEIWYYAKNIGLVKNEIWVTEDDINHTIIGTLHDECSKYSFKETTLKNTNDIQKSFKKESLENKPEKNHSKQQYKKNPLITGSTSNILWGVDNYNDVSLDLNYNSKVSPSKIIMGYDSPNGLKFFILFDEIDVAINIGNILRMKEVLNNYGEPYDNYYVNIATHDFDNDKNPEIILAIGDGFSYMWVNIIKYHPPLNISDAKRIENWSIIASFMGQSVIHIDEEEIIVPIGTQGIFEKYVFVNGDFTRVLK